MECEKSVVIITLLRFDYLVYDLVNCVDDTPTKTNLSHDVVACVISGRNIYINYYYSSMRERTRKQPSELITITIKHTALSFT